MKLFSYLRKKYDFFIYMLAFYSIRRMCEDDPGKAYFIELYLKAWRKDHPISENAKKAINTFYQIMKSSRRI